MTAPTASRRSSTARRGTARRVRRLTQPGVNVKEGDYLLAVNGVPLDAAKDPWAAFEGLADKPVLLTVNGKPTHDGAREVLVETLEDEYRLRNLAWINEKREQVEKASGGRIGYVYVPDTGIDGQTELVRQFVRPVPQGRPDHRRALQRRRPDPRPFRRAAQPPGLQLLGACATARTGSGPRSPIAGPKAMLINGWSGSGGDCFPLYFKQAGARAADRHADLGRADRDRRARRTWSTAASSPCRPSGSIRTDGKWIVEGHGVDPDIEVVDDPAEDGGGRRPAARARDRGGHAPPEGEAAGGSQAARVREPGGKVALRAGSRRSIKKRAAPAARLSYSLGAHRLSSAPRSIEGDRRTVVSRTALRYSERAFQAPMSTGGREMIKFIQCIRKRPELSHVEFRRLLGGVQREGGGSRRGDRCRALLDQHALTVAHNVHVQLERGTVAPFDGVAEFWFPRTPPAWRRSSSAPRSSSA